jgi:hypothetical protein
LPEKVAFGPASDDNDSMAQPQAPEKVVYICSLLAAGEEALAQARDHLRGELGPLEELTSPEAFDFTQYYSPQMGPDLLRQFAILAGQSQPGDLADVKIATNRIEADIARTLGPRPPRPVNLDPGYVEPSKLVLASMKNFSHRIYLRNGVYAEVTLQWRKGWQSLPWTFPDYASGAYDDFLRTARDRLAGGKDHCT